MKFPNHCINFFILIGVVSADFWCSLVQMKGSTCLVQSRPGSDPDGPAAGASDGLCAAGAPQGRFLRCLVPTQVCLPSGRRLDPLPWRPVGPLRCCRLEGGLESIWPSSSLFPVLRSQDGLSQPFLSAGSGPACISSPASKRPAGPES